MKKFTIYSHPVLGKRALKAGFSWPCFFFGLFWAVYKRLWLLSACFVALMVVAGLIETFIGSIGSGFWLVVNIAVAACANGLLENKLLRQGFMAGSVVEAEYAVDALRLDTQQKDGS